MLSADELKLLLRISRSAIESSILGKPIPEIKADSEGLNAGCGAFVSLHKDDRLRGCIGTLASANPLYKTVFDMAIAAATQDPRFSPVTPDELPEIKLEVSVISPMKEITGPSDVIIGKHGLYLVKGNRRGVLLPQVAIENELEPGEFLEQTCLKAGLDPDDWKEGATIFAFEADIIKEE